MEMIKAHENMNDMEKVKNNFLWILTVQEMEGLKWNNPMTRGFLMKLKIIVMEHPKHQKWKDIHIHQREMKNYQKQRHSFHLHLPIKAWYVIQSTHQTPSACPVWTSFKNMCWPLSGPTYQAPLSFAMTLHGYFYDFITLAVSHQEPQFQLAPRTIYHWNNLSWQWLYSKMLSNIAQHYSEGKHTIQQCLFSSTFPLRQKSIIIIALKKLKC